MNSHLASLVAPGTRLVVAIAPALTIGFMVRSLFNSMAMTELKASPVAFTPSSRCGLLVADGVAHQREDERLGDALDGEAMIRIADREAPTAHTEDAHPEERRIGIGKSGDVVGDGTIVEGSVEVMDLGQEQLDDLGDGRLTGGHRRGGRRLVKRQWDVHDVVPSLAELLCRTGAKT